MRQKRRFRYVNIREERDERRTCLWDATVIYNLLYPPTHAALPSGIATQLRRAPTLGRSVPYENEPRRAARFGSTRSPLCCLRETSLKVGLTGHLVYFLALTSQASRIRSEYMIDN